MEEHNAVSILSIEVMCVSAAFIVNTHSQMMELFVRILHGCSCVFSALTKIDVFAFSP